MNVPSITRSTHQEPFYSPVTAFLQRIYDYILHVFYKLSQFFATARQTDAPPETFSIAPTPSTSGRVSLTPLDTESLENHVHFNLLTPNRFPYSLTPEEEGDLMRYIEHKKSQKWWRWYGSCGPIREAALSLNMIEVLLFFLSYIDHRDLPTTSPLDLMKKTISYCQWRGFKNKLSRDLVTISPKDLHRLKTALVEIFPDYATEIEQHIANRQGDELLTLILDQWPLVPTPRPE